MELGIFARVPPEYAVRGFTEGGKKASGRAFFKYRALALLCRLWANFAITEFSEVRRRQKVLDTLVAVATMRPKERDNP